MADFKDVVKALAENNKKQDQTTDSVDRLRYVFEEHFKFLKRQIKDQEEAAAEAKKVQRQAQSSPVLSTLKSSSQQQGGGLNLGMLLSRAGLLSGFGALVGALEGLRGWELAAIKNIDSIGAGLKALIPTSVVSSLRQAFVNQRASILRTFGFDATLKAFGSTDDASLKTPLLTQITDAFKGLRQEFMLKYFGIGIDGKATVNVTGPGKALLAIEDGFAKIIGPFKSLGDGITKFLAGTGKAIVDFIEPFMKGASKFASLFGKILWPIGVVMSIFDGVGAYQTKEGDTYDKFAAGISAALGDFIGAPLNLLKSLLSKVFKLIGWDSAAETLDNVDIEKGLKGMFETVLGIPKKLFNWVGTLFSDPAEAGKQAWKTFLTGLGFAAEGIDKLTDVLMIIPNKFFNWIGSFLGWTDPENPIDIKQKVVDWTVDFFSYLSSWLPNISEIGKQIKDSVVSILPDWLKDYLIGSGTVDEAARKLQIAEYERVLKTIDKNNDNIITSEEYEEAVTGRANSNKRIQLRNALINLKELRGDEIPSSTLMEKGGQSITINNIEAPTPPTPFPFAPPTGSSDKKYLPGSGMSATDLRYEKKYMSMQGFGLAIGQVHQ